MPNENNDDEKFTYFNIKPRSKPKKGLVEKEDSYTYFEIKPSHKNNSNISNDKPSFTYFETNEITKPSVNLERTNRFKTQNIKNNFSNDKQMFTYFKTRPTSKPFNDQNLNLEIKEGIKTPIVQINNSNSKSKIKWEDLFISMNNQVSEKKSEDLKYANNTLNSEECYDFFNNNNLNQATLKNDQFNEQKIKYQYIYNMEKNDSNNKDFKEILNEKDEIEAVERYKISDKEKDLIKQEFSIGIPLQRIKGILDNHKSHFDEDSIERLQYYYNEMIPKGIQRLFLNISQIDKIIKGYDKMLYSDRSISIDSIKRLEFFLDKRISIIKDWRISQRDHLSGVRIQITDKSLEMIKEGLKNIPIERLKRIIDTSNIKNDFFQFIQQIYEKAIDSGEKSVKIALINLNRFITGWDNILYKNQRVLSKEDFNKLQMLIGLENPILNEFVYGKQHFKEIELKENEFHAELAGIFIVKGYITNDSKLFINFGKDVPSEYINHLKNLIINVLGRSPSIMKKDYFYISGLDIINYFTSQGLSNESRRVPSWIKKSKTWIEEHSEEWNEKFLPLVVSCIRGMINGAGSFEVDKKFVFISLARANKTILEDFKELCNSLYIETSEISQIKVIKENRMYYRIKIFRKDQVKRFLIDIVKPIKWELVKDDIQQKLKENDSSIDIALETSQEMIELKRKLFHHQDQKYTFLYHPERIKNITNLILRDRLYNYIEDISYNRFPYEEFQINSHLRSSHLKFHGISNEQKKEIIKTSFIKELLLTNLSYKKYSYDELSNDLYKNLLDLVRQVFIEYKKSHHNIAPHHEPILKEIMAKHHNATVSEAPVWKKLQNKYIIGHIDLILADKNTLYIADLKDDETDMLKSLPQIMSYGIMARKFFFKEVSDFNNFNLKLIVFTKNEIWEFDVDSLEKRIVEFIKYANSIRDNRLETMSDPRGDLQEEVEKIIAFLRLYCDISDN